MKHELCRTADVPAGRSIVVPFFGRDVHVFRSGNRLHAIANVCLHFGGPLECRDGRFVCRWHGAEFAADDTGTRLKGPAPANSRLMFLSTREENGSLFYVYGE